MPTLEFSTRQIVVTGDDFGLSGEVNAAIERYHRAGALQQASLMAAGPQVEEAVAIARRNPGLRVGLHLALCDAVATAPSALTDAQGRLPHSPALAGMRYAFSPWLRGALAAEIERQFARFRELGFEPTYWDGHTHLHLHPVVFALTLSVACAHGFKRTRLVREPGPPAVVPWIFERLSRAAIPRLRAAGIGFSDRVFGLRDTGRMNAASFRRALELSGAGETEIYFHPGADPDAPAPDELARLLA
jgi:hopanoid biosynthesis associated protein HpnK